MEVIGRDNPDMVQMASAVLGYATNKLAGKDEAAGAAVAQWGTKWNSALENPQLMVTMGLAYIAANSIVHINGTVLAVENASGEWVKTAEANAYIHMIEEIRNNPLSTTAEKEWASRLVFGIVVRDRSGEVIYNFPEDPKDFIPEGLTKKEYPGGSNGKIIHWDNPETGETEYSWHEEKNTDNKEHYHKGRDKKGEHEEHPDTGDTHMYPGDRIPDAE